MPRSPSDPLRVFVAGHSFHVFVATRLEDLVRRAGIEKYATVGTSAIGGSTVLRHWDFRPEPAAGDSENAPSPNPDSNPLKDALAAGAVDVLTLSPIWFPDEGIEKFARFAVAHNPDIRITVQEFWLPNDEYHPVYPLAVEKLVDHDAANLPALCSAQQRYQKDLHDYVGAINKRLGKQVLFTVPVGPAVVALRQKIAAGHTADFGKQSDLFSDSWGHPNDAIKQLVAYCHFAVISRRNPCEIPPASDAPAADRLLQQLAWNAATHDPLSGLQPLSWRKSTSGGARRKSGPRPSGATAIPEVDLL